MYEKWKQWQYYTIIGVISCLALFFLPMVGSEAGLAFRIPNTAAGWIVYIVSKILVATLNILIFHCFILQAKVNIRNNENFLQANEILRVSLDLETLKPKSPEQWAKAVYGKKGVSIFATSLLSAFGLTQAVLTFDWISMLTYLFTILMGIVFGILQMNKTEEYWTWEYLLYAKEVQHNLEMAKEKSTEQKDDHSNLDRRTIVLESTDCNRPISTDC